jgi:hypothetical protein
MFIRSLQMRQRRDLMTLDTDILPEPFRKVVRGFAQERVVTLSLLLWVAT